MKLIKSSKLKKGDWIGTKEINNILIEDKIYSKNQVAEILDIKRNEDGKKDIYLKNIWNVHRDNTIIEANMLANVEEIYLLNKKEIIKFRRMLILNKLK